MLNTAANLRVHSSWDTETTSTVVALRTLARRAHAMLKEARELQKAIVAATVLCAWSHPAALRGAGVRVPGVRTARHWPAGRRR